MFVLLFMGMCGAPCLVALSGGLVPYYYKEVKQMANIKSAKKRILVINKKTERNKAIRSKVKTYIKRLTQLSSQVIRPQQTQLF